jgi:WD40 repeat protein
MIASVSEDATCKIWENGKDKPFETLKGHAGKNVRALATFSNENLDIIATGGEDGAIKIWDI